LYGKLSGAHNYAEDEVNFIEESNNDQDPLAKQFADLNKRSKYSLVELIKNSP